MKCCIKRRRKECFSAETKLVNEKVCINIKKHFYHKLSSDTRNVAHKTSNIGINLRDRMFFSEKGVSFTMQCHFRGQKQFLFFVVSRLVLLLVLVLVKLIEFNRMEDTMNIIIHHAVCSRYLLMYETYFTDTKTNHWVLCLYGASRQFCTH